MRYLAFAAVLFIAGCEVPEEAKVAYLEAVEVGQALEARCKETGDVDDCAAFQSFKVDWSNRYSQPWEVAPKTL